ncbi:hypothetical protein ACOME3_003670 [Neoechinorhynchus agilis]
MRRYNLAYECADHPDSELIEDFKAGDLICPECAVVVGSRVIEIGREWENSDDIAKGNLYNLSYNMETTIARSYNRGSSDEFGRQKYAEWKPLNSNTKTLLARYKAVKDLSAILKVPEIVVEKAQETIKRITDVCGLGGYSQEIIVSAALYFACRRENLARSFNEICEKSKVGKRDLGRAYRRLLELLDERMTIVNPEDYVSRFCKKLKLGIDVESLAAHFVKKVQDFDLLSGRAAPTVAAGCIFMAAQAYGLKHTYTNISIVTAVPSESIRNFYRAMFSLCSDMYPKDNEVPIKWYRLPPP